MGGVAGSGGTAGSAGSGGTSPVDTKRPTVVSVSPTNNAKGVTANATITVTWSEPMNKATAQASFQCPDLAGKVTFEWPSATVMKVVPVSPLAYATGTHANLASLAAKTYSITLNTSAEDASGNELAAAYAFKFSTLRQVSWSDVASVNSNMFSLGSDNTWSLGDSDTGIFVGDWSDNSWWRMAVEFELTTIPTAAVGIASASFTIYTQGGTSPGGTALGKPFTVLGNLVVDHIYTPQVDASTLLLAPLRTLGNLTTSGAAGDKTIVVTAAVADDLAKRAQRNNRSQYRLQFPTTTNTDGKVDSVNIGYDSNGTLAAEYLVP